MVGLDLRGLFQPYDSVIVYDFTLSHALQVTSAACADMVARLSCVLCPLGPSQNTAVTGRGHLGRIFIQLFQC